MAERINKEQREPVLLLLAQGVDFAGAERTTGESTQRATQPQTGEETEASVAVLPFTDMSPQHDQDYFCDGMTEELINALSKVEGLRVASRTSASALKGKQEDIRRIGDQLSVRMVLEGSVRKAGDRLRINAQLVNVADGY